MAKPFVGYALVRENYSTGLRVLGVVNEVRRILYGRWADTDGVTNVSVRAVVFRYETAEEAQAASTRVETVYRDWEPKLREMASEVRRQRGLRDAAVAEAARPS